MMTWMKRLKTRFDAVASDLGSLTGRVFTCLSKKVREARICIRGERPPGEEMLMHMGRLLDSVASGIISLDGEGRVRVFNAAAESLFGAPRGAVIGLPFSEIGRIISMDFQCLRGFLERLNDAVWAAGAAIDLEHELTGKEGIRRVISYSVYPLGRTPWSVDNGVVIVLDDITRKKEMEDQIYDEKKKLQAVFDGITDGIQVIDGEFRVIAINRSMSRLLNRQIAAGGRCYEACVFGAKICEDCPALETFESGRPATVTKSIPSRRPVESEDRERVVEITTFPLYDRGNRVAQVVEYVKDVTERVQLAERLEHSRRLAELGEMAARVAHEVRNPLNAIIGAAHYLSTEYEGLDTARKFTDLIIRQASRVNQVASDLLALSRPQIHRPMDVNVNAVLEQAIDAVCGQFRGQNIEVRTHFGPDIPVIRADEMQIEQALQNILRNAMEAMPDGGALTVWTEYRDGHIVISIEDTGPGIPEDNRKKIFQSFFTTKTRGTGLGLTIVQNVLKNHNGDIRIEQSDSGGTRVVVRLPVRNETGEGQRSRYERIYLNSR